MLYAACPHLAGLVALVSHFEVPCALLPVPCLAQMPANLMGRNTPPPLLHVYLQAAASPSGQSSSLQLLLLQHSWGMLRHSEGLEPLALTEQDCCTLKAPFSSESSALASGCSLPSDAELAAAGSCFPAVTQPALCNAQLCQGSAPGCC